METTATTGGFETVVEQGQPETAGMDMATSHDLRETCPMEVKAQARVDSGRALWKEWADNDDREELLSRPLLESVILANMRALRRPPAPAISVIQAGWWTQEVANHPFCLKCEPAVLDSAKHRL